MLNKPAIATILILPFAGLLIAGCLGPAPEPGGVVATTYVVGFLAETIAGDDVLVTTLGGGNVEVHDFEPTLSDLTIMRDAGVILYHGLGLEPWLGSALDSMGTDGPAAVATAAFANSSIGMEVDQSQGDGQDRGGIDPHSWLDPLGLIEQSRVVEAAMIAEWPEHADAFRSRGVTLRTSIQTLHEELVRGLEDCTRDGIITNHDAYAYLAARYGFTIHSLQGIDPGGEPSPGKVADIISDIEDQGHTILFIEENTNPASLQAIVDTTGVELVALNTIEVTPEIGNYFSAMRENLAGLQEALGCPA